MTAPTLLTITKGLGLTGVPPPFENPLSEKTIETADKVFASYVHALQPQAWLRQLATTLPVTVPQTLRSFKETCPTPQDFHAYLINYYTFYANINGLRPETEAYRIQAGLQLERLKGWWGPPSEKVWTTPRLFFSSARSDSPVSFMSYPGFRLQSVEALYQTRRYELALLEKMRGVLDRLGEGPHHPQRLATALTRALHLPPVQVIEGAQRSDYDWVKTQIRVSNPKRSVEEIVEGVWEHHHYTRILESHSSLRHPWRSGKIKSFIETFEKEMGPRWNELVDLGEKRDSLDEFIERNAPRWLRKGAQYSRLRADSILKIDDIGLEQLHDLPPRIATQADTAMRYRILQIMRRNDPMDYVFLTDHLKAMPELTGMQPREHVLLARSKMGDTLRVWLGRYYHYIFSRQDPFDVTLSPQEAGLLVAKNRLTKARAFHLEALHNDGRSTLRRNFSEPDTLFNSTRGAFGLTQTSIGQVVDGSPNKTLIPLKNPLAALRKRITPLGRGMGLFWGLDLLGGVALFMDPKASLISQATYGLGLFGTTLGMGFSYFHLLGHVLKGKNPILFGGMVSAFAAPFFSLSHVFMTFADEEAGTSAKVSSILSLACSAAVAAGTIYTIPLGGGGGWTTLLTWGSLLGWASSLMHREAPSSS